MSEKKRQENLFAFFTNNKIIKENSRVKSLDILNSQQRNTGGVANNSLVSTATAVGLTVQQELENITTKNNFDPIHVASSAEIPEFRNSEALLNNCDTLPQLVNVETRNAKETFTDSSLLNNCANRIDASDEVVIPPAKKQRREQTAFDALPSQVCGGRILKFQPSWLNKFNWLFVQLGTPGVLCKICVETHKLGLIPTGIADGRSEEAFLTTGFRNWTKALDKFRVHEKSQGHTFGTLQLAQCRGSAIHTQLSQQTAKQQNTRRNAQLKIISSTRHFARQGLPLRGHDSKDGNLVRLSQYKRFTV